jgi:hypothetical protein
LKHSLGTMLLRGARPGGRRQRNHPLVSRCGPE